MRSRLRKPRGWAALLVLLVVLSSLGVYRLGWAVNANPAVGSVWTWLGPTYGADWMAGPTMTQNPASGYFLQMNPPPTSIASWLNSNNVMGYNPYGYLGQFGQMVIATNYGEPAFVGASRTSDTPYPNVCCSQGVATVTINDNIAHPATAWNFYDTGTRLAGAGALNNESDKFNLGTLAVTNPYTGNVNGQVGNWAFQCGGEPVASGLVGTHCNFGLKIGPNGDNYAGCCALLFDSGLGTIQAIGMAFNQRILWDSDSGGTNRAYVTSLVNTNGSENAMIFTNSGAFFYQGTTGYVSGNPGVNGAISNDPGVAVINHIALQGSAAGSPALIFAAGDDPNVPVAIKPKITNGNSAGGEILMEGPMQLQVTTVAALTTCSNATKYQMYAISDGNANLTYRSTTFTGGGLSAGIVFCNGTSWELH
jgi:hypothetical protein